MSLEQKLAYYIDKTTKKDMEQCFLSGAAVSVTLNGETIFRKAYGISSGREPLQENAIYRLASMTKPLTAFAILLLADRGLLRLDDPVSLYLPEYANLKLGLLDEAGAIRENGPVLNTLTIRHLLSHTNGLITGPLGVAQNMAFTPLQQSSLAAMVDLYPQCFLSFEPGTQAAYSAVAAFDVLARIIELISGLSYPDFMKKEIFIPLDMPDTTFVPNEDQWARMVPMHNRVDGKNSFDDMGRHIFESFPLSYPAGGAGLAGTLQDYERFAVALLKEGSGLLCRNWIHEMASPQAKEGIPGLSKTENWGLGVRVITNDPVLPKGCFGWSGAYGTHFWIDPTHQLTCVYMKNSRYDGGSEAGTARRLEKAVMTALQETL